MAERVYLSEEILRPVSAEQPAGRDLRFEPIFREILEARRDESASGNPPQWRVVAAQTLEALHASKDIRLCCFLTEAAIFLDAFSGLRDCLRLTREILTRFWDIGLFPVMESGDPDDRARPLAFFNERMAEAIRQIPLTNREGDAPDYGYLKFQQAQQIGRKDAIDRLPGQRRETVAGLIQQGWITADEFDAAMNATKRPALEAIYASFTESREQFGLFERTVDEKFGEALLDLSTSRRLLEDVGLLLQGALKKREAETPNVAPTAANALEAGVQTSVPAFGGPQGSNVPADSSGAWQAAESMVRSGQVEQGLQLLAALASQETSGRARYLRKIALVDACRSVGRDRLARTILEELNRQITEFKLDQWESSAIPGAVWTRLYRVYKQSGRDADDESAAVLYNQLCRLDPWQTFVDCED